MNPILMTLAAENAKKLAQMSLEGRGPSFELPVADLVSMISALTAWFAAAVKLVRRRLPNGQAAV